MRSNNIICITLAWQHVTVDLSNHISYISLHFVTFLYCIALAVYKFLFLTFCTRTRQTVSILLRFRWQRVLDVLGLADDAAVQRERHLDPLQKVYRGVPSPAQHLPQSAKVPTWRGVPLQREPRGGKREMSRKNGTVFFYIFFLSSVIPLYREARPLVVCPLSKRFREFPVSFSRGLINEFLLAINMTRRTPLRRRDYHFPAERCISSSSESAFSLFFFPLPFARYTRTAIGSYF